MGGGDKCLVPLAGRPLLAHVIQAIRPQVDDLLLNANGDPARFAAFGLPVRADPLPGFPGPLAGVLAGMRWAAERGAGHVLSLPADTPFFPPDLAGQLAAAISPDHPVACAASGDREHPVIAVWSVALAPMLEEQLLAGKRRVGAFARLAGRRLVVWPAAPLDPFFNVNTPDDLALAVGRLDPT